MLKFWPFKASSVNAAVPDEDSGAEQSSGQLCAVFSSYSPIEANIVSGMLQDNGVQCVLSNELISAMESPVANITGGVQVLVRELDAARAGELLREMSQPEGSSVSQEGQL
ncbi:MAG: DUF2007 domain-containing protein [Janthinobacterium lividum]